MGNDGWPRKAAVEVVITYLDHRYILRGHLTGFACAVNTRKLRVNLGCFWLEHLGEWRSLTLING